MVVSTISSGPFAVVAESRLLMDISAADCPRRDGRPVNLPLPGRRGFKTTAASPARAATARAGPARRHRGGLARTIALDTVVDRADAGRQRQPFGRVHGHPAPKR